MKNYEKSKTINARTILGKMFSQNVYFPNWKKNICRGMKLSPSIYNSKIPRRNAIFKLFFLFLSYLLILIFVKICLKYFENNFSGHYGLKM